MSNKEEEEDSYHMSIISDVNKQLNEIDRKDDILDFLDSQVRFSDEINKIEISYLCIIKDIRTDVINAIVKNLKDKERDKQLFDSDIAKIKLNSIKAFTDLHHDIVNALIK